MSGSVTYRLVVVQPFGAYAAGSAISDPAIMAEVLAGPYANYVVRAVAPDPTAEPPPPPSTIEALVNGVPTQLALGAGLTTDGTTLSAASATGAAAAAVNDPRFPYRITGATTDATPTALGGTPLLAPGTALTRVTGHVEAQNTATGAAASWDVAVLIERDGSAAPAIVGNPSISEFQCDATMAACGLQASASATGLTLTATGVAATAIRWSGALSA